MGGTTMPLPFTLTPKTALELKFVILKAPITVAAIITIKTDNNMYSTID